MSPEAEELHAKLLLAGAKKFEVVPPPPPEIPVKLEPSP